MLVVHPKDKTTAMLAALYDGLEVRLLDQSFKNSEVKDTLYHTSKQERIMMLGHGNFEEIGYWDGGEPIRIPIIGSLTYTDQGLAKLGARLYYYQPVEIDARVFATDTMSTYHKHLNA